MDEETEDEIIALQSMFEGSNFAATALMLALLDTGVIKKGRLLDIIESLHSILAAEFVGKFGHISDAEISLNSARAWLACSEWRENEVLETLHKIERDEFLLSQIRIANERKSDKKAP